MSKKESNLNVNASKEIKESSIINESKEIQDFNLSQTKEKIIEKQQSNLHDILKQTDLFQGSASTLLQNTSYPKDHWVVLESILQRNGIATKPTKIYIRSLRNLFYTRLVAKIRTIRLCG